MPLAVISGLTLFCHKKIDGCSYYTFSIEKKIGQLGEANLSQGF